MNIFIIGGAGFIGSNLAAYHLEQGHTVTVFDNLSRPRTQFNLDWLRSLRPANGAPALQFIRGDVRDFGGLHQAIKNARPDLVVHLASQVAVTTSVRNPREDFEINALGTFNVVEAVRNQDQPPALFFASTNKVYGGMEDVVVVEEDLRYRYRDFPNGISEKQPLDFHSPYGCSKGAGDQYVHDYARIYGLKTVVFRQSTIYGTRQFGVEDQGWLAHFIIATVVNRPISIYGNGKQVRDMLHVRDLIQAYEAAWHHLDVAAGQVFNVGGGAANTISIWTETGPILEALAGHSIPVTQHEWRPGDQPVFISDNTKAKTVLGWEPKIGLDQGVRELWDWVSANRALFE
jgi:CDP-paratose 2-epimerase